MKNYKLNDVLKEVKAGRMNWDEAYEIFNSASSEFPVMSDTQPPSVFVSRVIQWKNKWIGVK